MGAVERCDHQSFSLISAICQLQKRGVRTQSRAQAVLPFRATIAKNSGSATGLLERLPVSGEVVMRLRSPVSLSALTKEDSEISCFTFRHLSNIELSSTECPARQIGSTYLGCLCVLQPFRPSYQDRTRAELIMKSVPRYSAATCISYSLGGGRDAGGSGRDGSGVVVTLTVPT